MLHYLYRNIFRQLIQSIFMLPVPLVSCYSHAAVIVLRGLVRLDLRLIEQKAQLLHSIL